MSTHRVARRAALIALLSYAAASCHDAVAPTAPLALKPSLTQVAASPVVNSLSDPGDGTCDDTQCTLREAISFASSGATISFAPGLEGTDTLASGELVLNKNLTISGPEGGTITITGHNVSRVFYIASGKTVTLNNLTVTGGNGVGTNAANTFPGEARWGGGILIDGGGLILRNSTIRGNSSGSTKGGGGIAKLTGNLIIENSTISGNSGSWYGGGIYSHAGGLTIKNTTISGNNVTDNFGVGGGGIYNDNGIAYILYTTITGNSAVGIQTYNSQSHSKADTDTRMKGSIVSGNGTYDLRSTYGDTTVYPTLFTSLGYTIVGTTNGVKPSLIFVETDQTGVTNPGVDTLANNGGATKTRALLTGSPALNYIPSADCTDNTGAAITTDQRGITRPQGGVCDIGAYEKAVELTTPTFAFSLASLPAKTFNDDPFSISSYATTNSSGAITFALGSGSVGCSVSGGTVTLTGAAVDPSSCIIEASLASDGTYSAAGPLSSSFHIAKAAGSVTISNLPASGAVGGSFTPAYTKSGDGIASTASNSPSVCTVTSSQVNFIAAGSCLLQASVTEGTNHLSATGVQESVTVSTTAPTFTFNLSTLPAKKFGDDKFSVMSYVTTNSSGAITFALGEGSVGCSVSADTVTITGAAVVSDYCIIEASVASDGTYSSSGPVSQSFHIEKAAGSVSINNMPLTATIGDSFTPTYTMAGNGTPSTVSNTTGICTVTSGVVNFIAAGSCDLQASVTAGTNHAAATGAVQSVPVSLLTPEFTFHLEVLTKTFGNAPFSVADSASANSGGAITFSLGTGSSGCSVTPDGTVTLTGAAVDPSHCVIAASLAANGNYAAAGPIDQSFNIARAAGSVSISNMPSSAAVGGSFMPAYTKLGDGTASTTSLTTSVCTVTSGTVNFIAAGTCTLRASVTEGTDHLAADGTEQNVTVSAVVFASACTYTINAKNNQRIVNISWENASPGVTLIHLTDGRLVSKALAPTTTGSWSTNVKTGVPAYGLWGGTSRKDSGTTLVAEGTACTLQ